MKANWNPAYAEVPAEAWLEELRERIRRTGWLFDYIELQKFLKGEYREAGLPVPDAPEMAAYED